MLPVGQSQENANEVTGQLQFPSLVGHKSIADWSQSESRLQDCWYDFLGALKYEINQSSLFIIFISEN